MKHRGGRSLAMMAVVLAAATMPAAAAPLEYTDPVLHYHFTLPEGWIQIPDDVFKQAVKTTSENTPGVPSEFKNFEAGFQLASDDFFTYPYILVQEFSPWNIALSDIAARKNGVQKDDLKSLESIDSLQDIKIGRFVIDTRRNMVLGNMQEEIKDIGTLRILTVSCPGRKGVAQLHFYAREDDYKTYAPVFEQILDSFAFEKGYEYRAPLMAGRSWRAILVAVATLSIPGAVVAVIFAAANRKRRAS